MGNKLELSGKKFGKLTVISRAGYDKRRSTTWFCLCLCGSRVTIRGSSLTGNHTKSCGCLQKQKSAITARNNKTHGHSINGKTSPIYNSWTNMLQRCTNPRNKRYKDYGGRGITVCDRWECSFENFLEDMGEPPDPSCSLDRSDNNGNYCPTNCRWATSKEQSINKRTNHLITFRGITKCTADWSTIIGISASTIKARIKRGWPIEKVMTTQTEINKIKLCFNDILLVPRYSELESRNSPDISTHIGHLILQIPLISAPMDTITGPEMLCVMSQNGGLGILTRYITMSPKDGVKRQVDEIKIAVRNGAINIGCAIGIKNNTTSHTLSILDAGCNAICIDVAHGDHKLMHQRIEEILLIKNHHKFILIAGNVCTPGGAIGLAKSGVDAIKIGIGSGAICTTRIVSGFGVPQLSSILDIHRTLKNLYPCVSIVADGGLRSTGDMVKSIWGGADACMIGYMLAGTSATPRIDGKKVYRGMSSSAVSGRQDIAPEGIEIAMGDMGRTDEVVRECIQGIRSGLAMGGARNFEELRENVTYVMVSPLSMKETLPKGS